MQVSFVEPSCNYNIILTEADVNELLSKGYIFFRPERINGSFTNDHATSKDNNGHHLLYNNSDDNSSNKDKPVQFVGIALKQNKNREWL